MEVPDIRPWRSEHLPPEERIRFLDAAIKKRYQEIAELENKDEQTTAV